MLDIERDISVLRRIATMHRPRFRDLLAHPRLGTNAEVGAALARLTRAGYAAAVGERPIVATNAGRAALRRFDDPDRRAAMVAELFYGRPFG